MIINLSKNELQIVLLALSKLRGSLEEEIEESDKCSAAIDKLNKCDDLFVRLTRNAEN